MKKNKARPLSVFSFKDQLFPMEIDLKKSDEINTFLWYI